MRARRTENSFLDINYYQKTVKVASLLIFIMTFFLMVLLCRLISSLFVVLEYVFQELRKGKLIETKEKPAELHPGADPERRQYPRFNVYWPIQYNQMGSSTSHYGRVTNLSEGGMLIQSPGQMEIGQHLKSKLSFILGSKINTIEMQAEVVWRDIKFGKAWGDYQCGAKFLNISVRDKTVLNSLLMNLPQ